MVKAIETEEIVVATKDFTFEDYLKVRKLHLLVSIFYNGKAFKGFFKLIEEYNLGLTNFITQLNQLFSYEKELKKIMDSFMDETRTELFDSETQIFDYFSDDKHFKELLDGKVGGNLLQKYTCLCYMEKIETLVTLITKAAGILCDIPEYQEKLKDISKYYLLSFKHYLDLNRKEKVLTDTFGYDISSWLKSDKSLDSFHFNSKKEFSFFTSEEQ
jgi:hypothetical protein